MGTSTTDSPIAFVDRPDLTPRCPRCHAELHEIYRKGTGAAFIEGRTFVFFCPSCLEVLGMAQGRMI
jgi:hypothetical protein